MREMVTNSGNMLMLQNKVRGLLAAYRSKGFEKERTFFPSRNLRIGLKNVYLDARTALNVGSFAEFLGWVEGQLISQAPEYFKAAAGYDDLAGIEPRLESVPIEREIAWITARLIGSAQRITAFVALKDVVEAATLTKQYEAALHVLAETDALFGHSMWSVQLRIALEHQAGGLERQKSLVADIRSIFRGGLLGFVAYHTSVRNEDKTTFAKYVDDVKARLQKHSKYEEDVKRYLRYLLSREEPASDDEICQILRVEQNHSVIDLYETFIYCVQTILRAGPSESVRLSLRRSLSSLSEAISDPRLKKAALLNGAHQVASDLKFRSSEISTALFQEDLVEALQIFRRDRFQRLGADPWLWIYAGTSLGGSNSRMSKGRRQPCDAAKLIGLAQRGRENSEEALSHLVKLTGNFSGLRLFAGIADFLPALRLKALDERFRPEFVGLNSPTVGYEDMEFDSPHGERDRVSWDVWMWYWRPDRSLPPPEKIAAVMARSGALLNQREFGAATSHLEALWETGNTPIVRSTIITLLARGLANHGSRQNVIKLVASQVAANPRSQSILPIADLFRGYVWEDFKPLANTLAAPVALHMWQIASDDEKVLTWLRFATGAFLKSTKNLLPSRLLDDKTPYPNEQLIYFLRWICVPGVLDVARVIRGTRAVLEERQSICALLRELDSENSEAYQAEVLAISNQLALQEGQSIVDQSRIHVDTGALLRWSHRELSEDFERYLDLAAADLRPTKDFDEVLKELSDVTVPRSAFVAEDESDAVLYSLTVRMGNEFLLNPTFGFDFYLSKRVRHQSFVGLIRGPLEFSKLITTRESEGGDYRPYDYWLGKFEALEEAAQQTIGEALLRFGSRFDEVLATAKDNLFQVRSHEKPNAPIRLDINAQLMSVMRSLAPQCGGIQEFSDMCLAILWAALEPSLLMVRKVIAEEIQPRIAQGFDEMRATVRKVAESDPAFLSFDMEVGARSTEVQQALEDASRWFSRPTLEAQQRLFTLDQIVRISTESALKAQRAFDPILETVISGEIQLRASALIFVTDAIFVALDNVRRHSGVTRPSVLIEVRVDECRELLSIAAISQCKLENRSRAEQSLSELRQLIANRAAGDRTRRENRSGFLKLAAVVNQSGAGNIDFGFEGDDRFFLKVVYSLVIQPDSSGGQ